MDKGRDRPRETKRAPLEQRIRKENRKDKKRSKENGRELEVSEAVRLSLESDPRVGLTQRHDLPPPEQTQRVRKA